MYVASCTTARKKPVIRQPHHNNGSRRSPSREGGLHALLGLGGVCLAFWTGTPLSLAWSRPSRHGKTAGPVSGPALGVPLPYCLSMTDPAHPLHVVQSTAKAAGFSMRAIPKWTARNFKQNDRAVGGAHQPAARCLPGSRRVPAARSVPGGCGGSRPRNWRCFGPWLTLQHCGFARVAGNGAWDPFREASFTGSGTDGTWLSDRDLRQAFNAVKREVYPWSADLCRHVGKHAIRHMAEGLNRRGPYG